MLINQIMKIKENTIFESIIHMTEERDKRSLEKALAETISEFIDFDALVLLRIPRSPNSRYLEVGIALPKFVIQEKFKLMPHDLGEEHVGYDEDITLCIEKSEIIVINNNTVQRTLFPIIVNEVVSGVLDIYGYHKTANTDNLIHGFIRIYSNFQAIITDNEHDSLTGLLNRKTFDSQLSGLLSAIPKHDSSITQNIDELRTQKVTPHHWVGIMDIDFFKNINDKFGHIFGDEVLLIFSDLMKKIFRSSDLLFRYGGEEFVVVLTSISDSDAILIFERFRHELELFDFPQIGQVTVSTGIVKIDINEHSTTVLGRADKALYYSKENGRNQVQDYNELIKSGKFKEQDFMNDIELF